jgi:hypothetical protein
MKLGDSSRVSEMSPALKHAFSSPSYTFQLKNAPPTAAFAAITNLRKKRNIALGSPLAVIASTIQATRAHQQPISPRPNYSSIPPSVPLGQVFGHGHLNTPMPNLRYMHLHLNIISDKIIVHYNLRNIVTPDGWVYIEI